MCGFQKKYVSLQSGLILSDKKMKKKIYLTLVCALFTAVAVAQRADYTKMSAMVRDLVRQQRTERKEAKAVRHNQELCAFVRIANGAENVLQENGSRVLAQFGDICIASIPLRSLAPLSMDSRVLRIEARQSHSLLMDSTAMHVNALPVYNGTNLPQAYTGAGVVVGVEDVGFDLTHPTFSDSTATHYRVRRFWDFLSTDTVGSQLYVGAEYTTESEIKAYAHSRDGLILTHGTHTAGGAAGSGFDSKYRGMAWESDLCLVSNAVANDREFIDSADVYKYTYATDALGYKYIFDYAASQGKPCVISFSEGSHQDFRGDDQLFYAIIDSLMAPGRIFVAAAGNEGHLINYVPKPAGTVSAGVYAAHYTSNRVFVTAKADAPVTFRTTIYAGSSPVVADIASAAVLSGADSTRTDTLRTAAGDYIVEIAAYPSCYNSAETAYDIVVQSPEPSSIGISPRVSLQLVGSGTEAEMYAVSGYFLNQDELTDGLSERNVHSPGSAPAAICVGATGYRTSFINYLGEERIFGSGTNGERSHYSSTGPTLDLRTKPDVMAPGTNIISACSSYYIENNPHAAGIQSVVKMFDYNGRNYGWSSASGTSMATPVVAGAIALWLQAKPTLTKDEIMDVFSRTCTRYDAALTYPNNLYGYGQIDVYRGLLDILGLDGIGEISNTHTPAQIRVNDRRLTLSFSETVAQSFTVRIYSTEGKLLISTKMTGGQSTCQMDLSHLPKGVYAVQINGADSINGSTLIRL